MRKKEIGFFLLLFVVSLFLTFRIHKEKGQYNYRSEIWADRAGYYIYLPSLFRFHFDAKKCPEKIDEKTGYGFLIDKHRNTINTKYNYGVAALISPFYITASVISPMLHVPDEDGFGLVYHKIVNLAAVVYLMLGLWFLKKFLSFYFNTALQFAILLFTYAGTNLLFYSIENTLMSHVYSFFLFSLFLFLMKLFLESNFSYNYFLGLSVTFAFIVLIRPTNALVLSLLFLWDTGNMAGVKQRIRIFFKPKFLVTFCIGLFLVFLPQMIYWKYSRGGYLVYTYEYDTFSNWNHPKLLEVWFSTINGLFLYTPMVLLMVIGMGIMIVKRIQNGILTLALFFLMSYIFASWCRWYFGCGFGQRSYVEYYAIFSIPFGYFLRESWRIRNLAIKILGGILLLIFTSYNGMMSLKYDQCFFGSTWDWAQFGRQLEQAHLLCLNDRKYTFENDLENKALPYLDHTSDSVSFSGMFSARISPDREYEVIYSTPLKKLGKGPHKSIDFCFMAFNPGNQNNKAFIVCSIDKSDANVYLQSNPMTPVFTQKKRWQKLSFHFLLPDHLSGNPDLKLYFWNPERSSFFVDDLMLEFH